jgi:hypothetical protein
MNDFISVRVKDHCVLGHMVLEYAKTAAENSESLNSKHITLSTAIFFLFSVMFACVQ